MGKRSYKDILGDYGHGVSVSKVGDEFEIKIPRRPRIGGGFRIERKTNPSSVFEYAKASAGLVEKKKKRGRWI